MRHRAPFIWTPEQPIQHDVILAGIMGAPSRSDGPNRFFFLRRNFEVDGATGGQLHVTCDGRYRLFLNGEELGRGPARCTPTYQRYDTYDLTGKLRDGQNTLAVLVHTYGTDTSWYEMCQELWREAFGDGGLWLVADIDTPSGTTTVTTDTDWRVMQATAWEQDVPQANHGAAFVEVLDGRALPTGWEQTGFDDSAWPNTIEQTTGGGGPDSFFGGIEFRPFPVLVPNRLPAMAGAFTPPATLLWQKTALGGSDLQLMDQPYKEELGPPTDFDVSALTQGSSAAVNTQDGNALTLLFDMGRIVTGHVTVTLEAQGGEIIDLAVAEGIPGEWAEGFDRDGARIIPVPVLGADVHLSRYTARPGHQTFERFDWQAVRYLQVTIRGAEAGITLERVGVKTHNYPVTDAGHFSSDDDLLDKLWTIGRYTLNQCMHDGWEDCPGREQRQWSGDVTVENVAGHVAFGPDIAPLTAEYLHKTAESQRPDGLTQMFAPGNHGHTKVLIPDWTLQWILTAHDHLLWSGDLDTIKTIWPSIIKALAWFRRVRGDKPLVPNLPHWHFMDWAAVGRSGYACTLNAQLAGTLSAAAWMGQAVGDTVMAEEFEQEANDLRSALEGHWDPARGIYVDRRDPISGEQGRRVSQHANAAMILWGGAPAERYDQMISYMMDKERGKFTAAPPIKNEGEPVNEETDIVLTNTFYSHFLYAALNKAGRTDLVLDHARERYGPMLAAGATTLWESFEPTASLCHGFSASPTYQMSASVLGVQPTAPGATSIRFSPNLAGLDHAKGRVPLSAGDVDVALKATEDGFVAEITAPPSLTIDVSAAPGLTEVPGRSIESDRGKTVIKTGFKHA